MGAKIEEKEKKQAMEEALHQAQTMLAQSEAKQKETEKNLKEMEKFICLNLLSMSVYLNDKLL